MNKKIKRLLSLVLVLTLCLSFSNLVSAKEKTDNKSVNDKELMGEYTFEVSDKGLITARSSVSGYNQKTVVAGDNGLIINCNGQGYGGMGITIETSSSNGNFKVNYVGGAYIGSASSISGEIGSNAHIELNKNLWQNNLDEYLISFGVPSGVSMFVKVWIYG